VRRRAVTHETERRMIVKKLATIVVVSSIAALALGGCATTGTGKAAQPRSPETRNATVRPSGLFEDCMEISARQKMEYEFTSKKPVNFYIHYHDEGGRYELDNKDMVDAGKGTFSPNKKEIYCLTWTNPNSRTVDITYSFTVKKR
jgi:hypothetical protein